MGRLGLARTFGLLSRGSQVQVLPGAPRFLIEGLRPSNSPTRSLAGPRDPRSVRVALSLRSFAMLAWHSDTPATRGAGRSSGQKATRALMTQVVPVQADLLQLGLVHSRATIRAR